MISMILLLLALLVGGVAMMLAAYAGDLVTMIGAGVTIAATILFGAWHLVLEPYLEERRIRRLRLREPTATCAPGGGTERLAELVSGELTDIEELHLTLAHLDECERCAENLRVMILLRAARDERQQGLVAALPADRIPRRLM